MPDTRALPYGERPGTDPHSVYAPQYEERETTAAVTSASVPLAIPLTYAHAGMAGYRAHVANLTRSVTLRSANPNLAPARTPSSCTTPTWTSATRRSSTWAARPRSRSTDTEGGAHRHQPDRPLPGPLPPPLGPATPPISGHQFVLKGSVIERSLKWPVAVHNSHYGLIEDNVAYDWKGAGFVTEDGSETEVIFRRNFALRGTGIGGREGEGREGVGFWFRGTDVVVTDNVAANILSTDGGVDSAYGFKFYAINLGEVTYPIAPGSSTTTTRHGNATPVRQFEGNEVYGAIESGLTFWWIGTEGDDYAPRRARASSRTPWSGTPTTRRSSSIRPTA